MPTKAGFEKLLDGATSPVLLEPNWVVNLEICDAIRQNDVTPKYALQSIQKRMKDTNPHVCKLALVVLEACVKNCGETFHEEIATHQFMSEMRGLAQTGSAPVKEQVLAMVQAWNHAFRNNTKYQPISVTYNVMKMEGHNFPPLNESDAMFSSSTAPSWKEGDVCHLCRAKFGTFTRQHHCRACGEVFCATCSSKKSIIPKIGIEREVRVCDPCFDDINPNADNPQSNTKSEEGDESELPAEYLNSTLAKEPQTRPKLDDSQAQAQEEDELQLALALSLSQKEADKNVGKSMSSAPPQSSSTSSSGSKSKKSNSSSSQSVPYNSPYASVISNVKQVEEPVSELDKYLDRSYWEKKSQEQSASIPSAPSAAVTNHQQVNGSSHMMVESNVVEDNGAMGGGDFQNDVEEEENFAADALVNTMEKSIDMFVDQMNKAQMKGKHIAMDSSVQSLFHSLSAMHPQLLQLIEDEEESKVKYQAMLEKLAVIREARDTLDDMRAQHQEKVRQQELEQEMLRRMQMEQKLELMRQQKQEYLEYQRQLQIQRQLELDTYQREKIIQKQALPQDPGYAGNYSSLPPSSSSDYPSSIPQQQYASLPYTNQQPTDPSAAFAYPASNTPGKIVPPQAIQQQYVPNIQQQNVDKPTLQTPQKQQQQPYQIQEQDKQAPPMRHHNAQQFAPSSQQQQQQQQPNQLYAPSPSASNNQQPVHGSYGQPIHAQQNMHAPPTLQSQGPPSLQAQGPSSMPPQGPSSLPPNVPPNLQTQGPASLPSHGPPSLQSQVPANIQQPQSFPNQQQQQPQFQQQQNFQTPPQQLQHHQQQQPQQPQQQQYPPQQQQQSSQHPQQPQQTNYSHQNQPYQQPPPNQQPQPQQGYYDSNQLNDPHMQPPPAVPQQSFPQQPVYVENLSGNMKDLQLISFD